MAGGPTQSASAGRPPARPPWRGAAPHEAPRHRWQQGGGLATSGLVTSTRWWQIRVGLLFALAGGLLLALIWYLLHAPVQTPVVAVVTTSYQWPLPPNAWAQEDLAGLKDLHDKTLQVADLSMDWRSAERGLSLLDEELKRIAQEQSRAPVFVLYLSMHGAIDGSGRPCLIPAGAVPQDSRTWLPLATVLEHVKAAGLPRRVHKLLVLDCSRQPLNWHIGQLGAGFADALPAAISAADVPNLAVLSSAGTGDAAVASPCLKGSVFGHYLRLGIAGAADHDELVGNDNGRVSLQELEQYLKRHTQRWMAHHRGLESAYGGRVVIPAEADFDVAWSLRTGQLQEMVAAATRNGIQQTDPSVPEAKIIPLWTRLDQLRGLAPWRFDPLGWRRLEHRLLSLEQLACAGKAYEEAAHALVGELTNELNQAEERRVVAARDVSLRAHVALLSPNVLPEAKVHSLPLAAYWGTVDPDKLSTLSRQVARCQADPSLQNFADTIAVFDSAALPATMSEGNLLSLWQRLAVPFAWHSGQPLAQVLQAEALAELRAVPPAVGPLPGDERAHTWVRPQVAAVDRARRDLEDRIILGEARGDGNLAMPEISAQTLEHRDFDERVAKAFALRDRLWAEIPYLAAWLCRLQPDPKGQDAADEVIRGTLLPLLADANALERELERSESAPENGGPVWTAASTVDAVETKLSALEKLLQTAVAELSAATDDASAMREIEAILAVPFLTWDARQRLSTKRLALDIKLAGSFVRPDGGAGAVAAPEVRATPRLARLGRWRPHPLTAILEIATAEQSKTAEVPSASSSELIQLAAYGEQVRQRLMELTEGSAPAAPRFTTSAVQSAARSLTELCRTESKTRRAAGLWFQPPGIDPVRELRRADLQQFFLWRAARALDDFAGPSRPGGEPLFAASANDYLALARALGPYSEATSSQAEKLAGLLARRRIAAQEALAVTANDILLVEQAATVAAGVEVRAKSPEAVSDLPLGTAAIFLADQTGRLGPAAQPLPVPMAGVRADQSLLADRSALDTASLKSRGPFVQAIATLRGNDFVAPVLLRAPGGAQVEFRPAAYGPPQVTVLGYDQKRASAVFVLDCSHSMREATAVEAPDAAIKSESTRIEVAKGALRALLGELSQRGNLRIGVRLFGHRVGWSTTEADKLLRQTGYAEEIPAELRPYADVEQVLPLGRFDSLAAGKVYDRLQTVRAWGESPLYLALQQAIADFGPDDTAAKSVVVITDGQNYQFNPPREFAPALSEVIAAAERGGVAVHIVGFDIPAGEASAARRDFEQIASRTGGSFAPVRNATALIETLERLLRPGEFRVTAGDGALVAKAELGHAAILPAPSTRRSYEVTFEHAHEPIEVAGGEAVELTIRRGASRLEVVPYLNGNPRFEPLVGQDDGMATQLQAGIHRSVRTQDGVQFPISIQHVDGHFVPRPAEIWIEIVPLGLPADQYEGLYLFYDAPFAGGTAVPLANLLAHHWPARATRAEVRAWAKGASSTPAYERALSEVADRLPEGGTGFSIPGISGVTYQVRTAGGIGQPLTVGLIERHDQQSAGVGSLKVALLPHPDQVTHQFDPRNKLVLHTFSYQRSDERLSGRITIQFTTRDGAQQHAWRAAQPVVVDVSGRSDVLELSPAARQ